MIQHTVFTLFNQENPKHVKLLKPGIS